MYIVQKNFSLLNSGKNGYNFEIEGLDVNIYISNQGVNTLNVELRYVVLKLRKKMQLSQLKKNFFEEPWPRLRNVL